MFAKKLSMNFSFEGETEAEYYRNLAEEAALKQNKTTDYTVPEVPKTLS